MLRPEPCENCSRDVPVAFCRVRTSCKGLADAYDAGVTAERERWEAAVDAAIAKHHHVSRKELVGALGKGWRGLAARVLLEILEAMEQP